MTVALTNEMESCMRVCNFIVDSFLYQIMLDFIHQEGIFIFFLEHTTVFHPL